MDFNLDEMTLSDVVERISQLDIEVGETQDVELITKHTEEKKALLVRQKELEDLEQRKAEALALNNNEAKGEIIERKEVQTMENKITPQSKEYRDAFYAKLQGKETAEQRALLNIDGSTDETISGTNVALPHTLDEKIWDNIHEAHPILADITTIRSGIVMDINKVTAVSPRASAKKDGDATPELAVTIVPVTLAGKDYPVSIPMSYAMDSMNPNGLEEMLSQFIADEIGEALAKDVIARMISDATTSRKVTATTDMFNDVKGALAMVKSANQVVYAGNKYYDILGYRGTDGHAESIETTLKCKTKYEPACGNNIVVVDPKAFVLNEVVSLIVEREKSVKDHKVYVGGFQRAEGAMRDTRKVSYIA